MSAQSAMQGLAGTIVGGAASIAMGAKKLGIGSKQPSASSDNSGIDMQMAAKARKEAQQKINAIYANKELSAKARTRRVGQILDKHKGGADGREK